MKYTFYNAKKNNVLCFWFSFLVILKESNQFKNNN